MGITNYLWDSISDNVIAEFDESGETIATYTTEPTLHDAVLSQDRADSGERHFYGDGTGDVTEVTNGAGAVTDTARYSAFGEDVRSTGAATSPYRFKGRYGYHTDAGLGRVCVRRRLLRPYIAAWLSPHWSNTLAQEPQINTPASVVMQALGTYQYVYNNPVNYADPGGASRQIIEVPWPVDEPQEFVPGIWPVPVRIVGPIVKRTSTELECPIGCCPILAAKCRFEFALTGIRSDFGGLESGAEVRLTMSPGRFTYPSALAYPDEEMRQQARHCWRGWCQSDIDRPASTLSHFTVVLPSGISCRFDATVFPPRQFGPIDWARLNSQCRGVIIPEPSFAEFQPPLGPPATGVSYRTTRPVRRIVAHFTMRVGCGCLRWGPVEYPDDLPIDERVILEPANWSTLTLNTDLP